ncbi:extensin family protein [Hyphomicrobium denitrificans]|uniref:extensin family protein n=1 Tax=Hyphomicrobium denitrificans TaxID=53399 RepID=UPI00022E60D0|nr:extensin family protein [Hyphomicrobium denitrificans]
MTNLGRTAIVLAATAAISLLIMDTAAAKVKKHKLAPPAPAESAQSTSADKAANANGTADQSQKHPSNSMNGSDPGAKQKAAENWTDAEIADAKAHCAVILQRIHAVYAAHEPIKEGACGAPAPIELISIGQNPEVSFSPPPVVRCDLAEVLVNWLENDLQPLARKHFGAPIIKIETMSDYSCRNAYGRKATKLSEHGLANAIDIGAFVTASAKSVSVLDDWGTTQRELAEIAEEKAVAEKRAAEMVAAEKAQQTNLASSGKPAAAAPPVAPTTSNLGAPAAGLARSTIVDGVPKVTVTLPGASIGAGKMASNAGEPARLGGPAPGPDKARAGKSRRKAPVTVSKETASGPGTEDRAFLHEAHAAACHLFGTTLGPEANADHRNHFHVDMAPRKLTKICD